jgi:hypothetical protein
MSPKPFEEKERIAYGLCNPKVIKERSWGRISGHGIPSLYTQESYLLLSKAKS